MTAPPDLIFAYVAHDGRLMGITDAKANPNIDWPAYLLLDGPTMQAAISAAESRGREQALWDAIEALENRAREILRDPAMEAKQTGRGAARYDQAILCAELIRDMLPDDAPPLADGGEG